jgi:hypothetical protein
MTKWVSCVILATVCGMAVGCGSGGSSMPLVPVSGEVTFGGGLPPKSGTMSFSQIAGTGIKGLPNRPGRAEFGDDGRFTTTTFQPGDGLLPGKYQVRIECMDGIPDYGVSWETVSFVPLDFQPPELVVEEGKGPIEVSYDVPPNPKKRK